MSADGVVLVVDDDPDIRDSVADALDQEGFRAICAADGRDALQVLAREGPPAFVLLDLMMPAMDGAAFCARLRATPAWTSVPVVVFSAHRDAATLAAQMGADAVLSKPVRLADLMDVAARFAKRLPAAASGRG